MDFIKELEKRGIFVQFVNNLHKRHKITLRQYIEDNPQTDFKEMIFYAFNWGNTPEGSEFWQAIGNTDSIYKGEK